MLNFCTMLRSAFFSAGYPEKDAAISRCRSNSRSNSISLEPHLGDLLWHGTMESMEDRRSGHGDLRLGERQKNGDFMRFLYDIKYIYMYTVYIM